MVLNQKPRKPIMFFVNSSKKYKITVNPKKIQFVIIYQFTLMTMIIFTMHKNLKIASGNNTEWILNRDKNISKNCKEFVTQQNIQSRISSSFTQASSLKIGNFVVILISITEKGMSKKELPFRKRPFQIIEKFADVTYKFLDYKKKELLQHRNNLLPYFSKE